GSSHARPAGCASTATSMPRSTSPGGRTRTSHPTRLAGRGPPLSPSVRRRRKTPVRGAVSPGSARHAPLTQEPGSPRSPPARPAVVDSGMSPVDERPATISASTAGRGRFARTRGAGVTQEADMTASAARPVALVTGASSGLGHAYARQLAEGGWDLVPVARRASRLEALAARLQAPGGVTVLPLVADLTDEAGLALVAERIDRGVDLVVNCAGFAGYMPFAELSGEVADSLIDVHVRAVTHLTGAAVRAMVPNRRGAIINVASLLAFSESAVLGRFNRAAYAGCKAFIVTFTQ